MKPVRNALPPENVFDTWNENDSKLFIELGETFTPRREEVERTFLQLINADKNECFTVLELGCGSGWLSAAILKNFPNAKVILLDGSETMLSYAAEQLKEYKNRTVYKTFQLEDENFLDMIKDDVKFVVSSLLIHRLFANDKQTLFKNVYQKIIPHGGFLIFDLIEPVTEVQRKYLQQEFDDIVKKQSQNSDGNLFAYDYFIKRGWNYFAYLDDPNDKPSPLFEQLKWFEKVGFNGVDVFWCFSGHAIYGGYKF